MGMTLETRLGETSVDGVGAGGGFEAALRNVRRGASAVFASTLASSFGATFGATFAATFGAAFAVTFGVTFAFTGDLRGVDLARPALLARAEERSTEEERVVRAV